MSHQQPATASGKESTEPEIIPPFAQVRLRDRDAKWTSVNTRGTYRIYVTRFGPVSAVLLALGIGLLAAALVLVLAIGTFLIWIPLVALLVTATIIFALLRQSFRR